MASRCGESVFAVGAFAGSATTTTTTISTATTTPSSGVATTTTTTSSSSTTLVFPGASFVAGDPAPRDFLLIQTLNGSLCLAVVRHLHKGETAGAPRFAIDDDADASDLTILTKRLLDFVLCCSKRQIADVNICH